MNMLLSEHFRGRGLDVWTSVFATGVLHLVLVHSDVYMLCTCTYTLKLDVLKYPATR